MKFYDTNALLELQGAIFDEPFAISSESLKELEAIKTATNKDQGVKYQARQIARLLLERQEDYDTQSAPVMPCCTMDLDM